MISEFYDLNYTVPKNFKDICQFLSVIRYPVRTQNIPLIKINPRKPGILWTFFNFEDFYYDSYLEKFELKKFKFEKLVKNLTGVSYKVQSIFERYTV